jgi:antitoxin component of MazEF toxin-antitoxin module
MQELDMKITKKLFKHGGSLALVVPSEFTQHLNSDEVTFEIVMDIDNNPTLILTPVDELDQIENDPNFALFINAIYQDALAHPEKLWEEKDVWGDRLDKLLEGVERGGDDE